MERLLRGVPTTGSMSLFGPDGDKADQGTETYLSSIRGHKRERTPYTCQDSPYHASIYLSELQQGRRNHSLATSKGSCMSVPQAGHAQRYAGLFTQSSRGDTASAGVVQQAANTNLTPQHQRLASCGPSRDCEQPPPGWDLARSAAELWRLLCPLWPPCPPSQPCQASDPGAWPSSWVQELCHQPLALHLGWCLLAAQARQTWQSRCRSASQPAWTPLHTNNKVCDL